MLNLELTIVQHAHRLLRRTLILVVTHGTMHEIHCLVRVYLVHVNLMLLAMLALQELEHETLELLIDRVEWHGAVACLLEHGS